MSKTLLGSLLSVFAFCAGYAFVGSIGTGVVRGGFFGMADVVVGVVGIATLIFLMIEAS